MDLTEKKIKQEPDQGINHFARIPEDLLLSILSKMDDLKYLCWCSLVSKRFNSTVHLIDAVSLTVDNAGTSSYKSAAEMNELFYDISSSFTIEQIHRYIQSSSLKWLNFLLLLHKFKQLKTISLKFACPADLCSFSLFEMKVRFSDRKALVERLILIEPTRVYKLPQHPYLGNDFALRDSVTFCKESLFVGCGLCLLLKCQPKPSLESVVITNTNTNRGRYFSPCCLEKQHLPWGYYRPYECQYDVGIVFAGIRISDDGGAFHD